MKLNSLLRRIKFLLRAGGVLTLFLAPANLAFIGQTKRALEFRLSEHQRYIASQEI